MEDLTEEEVILAGLEGRGSRRRNKEGRGKRRSRGSKKRSFGNESGASRNRRQFLDRAAQLPEDIQKNLVDGKAQISDSPYYATGEIKGTRAELIKISQSEELGITNIDNGKLNKGRHLTLSGIKLLYDENDIDGAFTDLFPADLLNGEWELEINGKKVFPKQPIRKFYDGFVGYNNQKPFGLYVLDNPKKIDPQTPFEFNVDLPNEVDGFLKVFFVGTVVYGY
ncbi:MAG: hypothetical protein HRT71_09915 [Flavobacteriales bacterium]|nr:hypothetical protein [Flavobacteriales bacterium]